MTDLTESIDSILQYYVETEELLLNNEYKFSIETNKLEFTADLLTDEIATSITIPPTGEGEFIYQFGEKCLKKEGTLETILKSFMDDVLHQRDSRLDTDLTSPTTPNFGDNVDWDKMDSTLDDIDEGDNNKENSLQILADHVLICNLLFGWDSATAIKNTTIVRASIGSQYLPDEQKKSYSLKDNQLVTISIHFSQDYTNHTTPPKIDFKRGSSGVTAYGEQLANMARAYVPKRWKDLCESKTPLLDFSSKLYYKQDQISKNVSLSMSTMQIAEMEHVVSSLISETGKASRKYAMALCLIAMDMDILKAVHMYKTCGGEMGSSDNGVDETRLLEVFSNTQKKYGSIFKTNFIVEFITYLTARSFFSTRFCCICDRQIQVPYITRKPTVCTNYKCQFDYIKRHVCASVPMTICPVTIGNDLLDNPFICDMLISFAYAAAANTSRRQLIFKPFPPMYVSSSGTQNFDAVVNTLKNFPNVDEMTAAVKKNNEMGLKSLMKADGYELLKWILTCDRIAMVLMSKDKQIPEMKTEHQYMMLVDDPEKTRNFARDRKKYGSYFAFHGSGIENWHSILRRGLVVASGTSLQTTGAAYGSGVYLAPQAATSWSYSKTGASWPKSKFGNSTSLKCMSICEVVKHPDVPHTPSPYYVVKHPQYISTRFFAFYPTSVSLSVTADTLKLHKYLGEDSS